MLSSVHMLRTSAAHFGCTLDVMKRREGGWGGGVSLKLDIHAFRSASFAEKWMTTDFHFLIRSQEALPNGTDKIFDTY